MKANAAEAGRREGRGQGRMRARRRPRGKGGRFVAAPREEELEVKDLHPYPDFTTTTTTEDQERQQVAVVGEVLNKRKKEEGREGSGLWAAKKQRRDRGRKINS